MKLQFLLSILLSLVMTDFSHSQPADETILRAIEEGNKLISALEEFNNENGNYPEELEALVPSFLSDIPETGLRADDGFTYSRVPDELASDYIYGYRLVFFVSNTSFLGDRTAEIYLYQPSKEYPSNEAEKTIEIIDGWAHQEINRSYN